MRRNSRARRYRYTGEGFDSRNPTANALRKHAGGEVEMDPESRRVIMERLRSLQHALLTGPRPSAKRLGRIILVPAAAVMVAIILFIVIFFSGGDKPVPPARFAHLGPCTGSVQLREPAGEWRDARKGERLGAGWGLRSAADSIASITFNEGSTMRLTDDSEAFVEDLGPRSVTVRHLNGGTYHRVHKGSSYTVLNGDVSMRALGTAFNVENRSPGNLEIVSVESAVQVEVGDNEAMKVSQGEVMVVAMTDEKKAEIQPVSRERLEEDRLYTSAREDAESGNTPAVYEELNVPLSSGPPPGTELTTPPAPRLAIELGGTVAETGVSLEWGVSGEASYDAVALLKSGTAPPAMPGDEIATYSDLSINTATDNSVLVGQTYQYRLAALEAGEVVDYSNTIVLTIPKPKPKPVPVTVSLTSTASADGVKLEWTVSGASRFSGFVVERVVSKAPQGSPSPQGTSTVERVTSSAVLYTYPDTTVLKGHTYTYRVGLLVDGAIMVYSNTVTAEVPLK